MDRPSGLLNPLTHVAVERQNPSCIVLKIRLSAHRKRIAGQPAPRAFGLAASDFNRLAGSRLRSRHFPARVHERDIAGLHDLLTSNSNLIFAAASGANTCRNSSLPLVVSRGSFKNTASGS